MRVAERQRALSQSPATVPRLPELPAETFLDLFYAGGRPVVIAGPATADVDDPTRTIARDRVLADAGHGDAPVVVDPADARFASLVAGCGTLPYLTGTGRTLRIDAAGGLAARLQARCNRMFVQLAGRAQVLLVAPGETDRIAGGAVRDGEDMVPPGDGPAARSLAVELDPGDALFVPVGWWHQRCALSAGAVLDCTGFVWPNEACDAPDISASD